MSSYLVDLTVRLARGVAELPVECRERHANYIVGMQRDDGGFAGREGDSDLYYTGFALRSIMLLGRLDGEVAERSAEFLQGRLSGRESIVDFLSLIYGASLIEMAAGIDVFAAFSSNWRDAVAETMGALRRPDGGYAKGQEGVASSTYHTFLVMLCLELIERPLPDRHQVVEFLLSQRAEGGGFREIRASKRAGTNPTAAAIGAMRMLEALDGEIREDTIDFLLDMQTDEGGLRANTRIPIADLLSTFTGTLTLIDLGGFHELDVGAAERYVHSLQREDGGFHGAAWDSSRDVEYTFYGLGSMALFALPPRQSATLPSAREE
jgi:geranylgeranyl transferase type-2 subunit beta